MRSYSDPTAEKHYMLCDEEWEQLDRQLGKLCYYAAWNVAKSNGAVETSLDDIQQECFLALIRSLMYFKRQVYIERGFAWLDRHVDLIPDPLKKRFLRLTFSWQHRKQFSGKNGFLDGDDELASIIEAVDTTEIQHDRPPSREAKLDLNQHFMHYAKAIIWRTAKNYGADIKQEKDAAARNVSLSDCEFLDVDISGQFNDLVTSDQIKAITHRLHSMPDSRPAQIWDLATNGSAMSDDGEDLHRGRVRRSTGMAYHTIRNQVEVIHKVVVEMGGVENPDFLRVNEHCISRKDKDNYSDHPVAMRGKKVC